MVAWLGLDTIQLHTEKFNSFNIDVEDKTKTNLKLQGYISRHIESISMETVRDGERQKISVNII